MMTKKDADYIKNLLKSYSLPTKLLPSVSAIRLISAIKLDKKMHNDKKQFIIPTKLGKIKIIDSITNRDIIKACKKHA